jgi:small subunit ribosomal protein S10
MTNKKEASKIRIKLKSFDHRMIDFSVQQIIEAAERTGASVSAVPLPTKIKRFCVLRSPHVDKKSREHFEVRLYKRLIDISTKSPAILDLLLKTELPSGVSCSLKVLESV